MDRKKYEDMAGPIETPYEFANYCVHLGRQLGKTTTLAEILPNEPCVVLVHRLDMSESIKRTIRELRPDYDLTNIKFVNYNMPDQLRGLSRPIYVDNAVLDIIQTEYVRNLNVYFYAINNLDTKGRKLDDRAYKQSSQNTSDNFGSD